MKSKVTYMTNKISSIPTRLTLNSVKVVSVLSRVEDLKEDTTPYYKQEWVKYDTEVEPASTSGITSRVDEEWEEFAKNTYYNTKLEESILEFVEVETV